MATHTETHGGNYGRKFAISRENGLTDKNGRPYFFEYLPQLPANTERRKFETRPGKDGNPKHYELFSALDGYLIGVDMESKMFNGTAQAESWLILTLIDATEEYRVEAGQIDGRFSIDIMRRLLDPRFDPNYKIRLSPYAFAGEDGKPVIGVSMISGVDTKLESKKDAPHLAGIPQPSVTEHKGKNLYDWMPVAKWLYEKIQRTVVTRLTKDPISAPQRTPMPTPTVTNVTTAAPANDPRFPQYAGHTSAPFPAATDAPPVDESDLPF